MREMKPRGILCGVYALLEKLGYRFTFPRPHTELVPTLDAFLPFEDFTQSPILQRRGMCLYGLGKDSLYETLLTVDWMAMRSRPCNPCLCTYIRLGGMYHALADNFDADHDTWQGRFEPLFDALARLRQELGACCITPAYARWRLIGRGHLFLPGAAEVAPES
ncbi:MAG: hypothetical protein RR482_01750 [Clostridia bacterium]